MKYYTIFLGNKLWKNCIDDMNTDKNWCIGGMLWTNEKHAIDCMKNLKAYDFETKNKKFKVIEVNI